MMQIPDNYSAFEAHDARQQAELEQLPLCCECREPIQDDYCYEINDEYICAGCLKENHRKAVEDCI